MDTTIIFIGGFILGYFLPKILIENNLNFSKSKVIWVTILTGLIFSSLYAYNSSEYLSIGDSLTSAFGKAIAMNLSGNLSFAITFYNYYTPNKNTKNKSITAVKDNIVKDQKDELIINESIVKIEPTSKEVNEFAVKQKKQNLKILFSLKSIIKGNTKEMFFLSVWVAINIIIFFLSMCTQLGETSEVWMHERIGIDYLVNEKASYKFFPFGTINLAYYDWLEFLLIGILPVIFYFIWTFINKKTKID